jgi:hypothetical protein
MADWSGTANCCRAILQYQTCLRAEALCRRDMDRNDDHHDLIALAQDYHKVDAELIAMLEPTKHAEIK